VVQGQPKRFPSALVVSFAWHVLAVILTIATISRHTSPADDMGRAQPRDSQRTIFLVDPRASGGGDSGGKRLPKLPDAMRIPEADIRSVPSPQPTVRPDSSIIEPLPRTIPAEPPLVQPFASLIPVSSEPRIAEAFRGSLDDDGDEGTGGGRHGGDGSGNRPGRGPGTDGGEGGGFGPGSGVTAPHVIREVKPQYTADAMNARIQGTVRLECVVRSDGRVGPVRVLRSLDPVFGLDREAVDAARQWVFVPAMREGRPVDVLVTIELLFTLR
jgi:periplasmic protein TonB